MQVIFFIARRDLRVYQRIHTIVRKYKISSAVYSIEILLTFVVQPNCIGIFVSDFMLQHVVVFFTSEFGNVTQMYKIR